MMTEIMFVKKTLCLIFAVPCILTNVILDLLRGLLRSTKSPEADDLTKLIATTNFRNKVVIITGSNTGIGERSASRLSKLGATVLIACRDSNRGKAAELKLTKELEACDHTVFPFAEEGLIKFVSLDLNSLTSVVLFARIVKSNYKHVDVLINNAGLSGLGTSLDGLQQIFQANYLGHFLLFKLMRPLLSGSSGEKVGRVVNLSSVLHHLGEQDFRKSTYRNEPACYSDTKLYMNYLTLEINKRYGFAADTKKPRFEIEAVSVNPGAVMSDVWRIIPQPLKMLTDFIMGLLFLSCHDGSASSVMGAIMPSAILHSYYKRYAKTRFSGGLSYHAAVPYLIPYNSLLSNITFASELLGPYTCPHFCMTSNPSNIEFLSLDLWGYSTSLCISKVKEAWKGKPELLEDFEKLLVD